MKAARNNFLLSTDYKVTCASSRESCLIFVTHTHTHTSSSFCKPVDDRRIHFKPISCSSDPFLSRSSRLFNSIGSAGKCLHFLRCKSRNFAWKLSSLCKFVIFGKLGVGFAKRFEIPRRNAIVLVKFGNKIENACLCKLGDSVVKCTFCKFVETFD